MKNKGIKEKEKIVQILSIFWLNKNELLLNGYFKKKKKIILIIDVSRF